MGQALGRFASENQEQKAKEIEPVLESCYESHFGVANKEWTSAEFYRALCEIVEEINKKQGSTQLRVPSIEKLEEAFEVHKLGKGRKVSKEEFQKILQEVLIGTGFTSAGGAKDFLFFIFGVPAAAVFVKNRIAPKSVPNDFFLPAVTSATVFLLGKLNKI